MYVAEYRRLVEARILELVINHPTIKAIQQGQKIDDWQLLELERTLTKELGEGDLEVTPENLKKVFAHTADSFLGLVRQVLDMQYLPDYKDLVARQFETYVTQHNYNADQIRFLRAVQSVFLQKRHLETADLYDAPALVGFGQDAVERWFTENEEKATELPKEQRTFNYIVNEALVRKLGFASNEEALGRMITSGLNNINAPIVGVVKDFRTESLHKAVEPTILLTLIRHH